MNRKIVNLIGLTVLIGIILCVGVVVANAQDLCVVHPLGDIVPCTHFVWTAYGRAPLHEFDVIPCVHLVPCY